MGLNDEEHMRLALGEAIEASHEGEIPVGCVVVSDGKILSRTHNKREHSMDPTAHAEMLALRESARCLSDWRLDTCTMYVTLEPCPMCAAAIVLARVRRLVFGAYDFDNGAVGSNGNTLVRPMFGWTTAVQSGVLRLESEALLKEFFAGIRSKRRGG
jgi:tRNA(adenine34) deaminase